MYDHTRHTNPDGTPGGWVERGAYVAPSVILHEDSVVSEGASVLDGVETRGPVRIRGGNTVLNGKMLIAGDVAIKDTLIVTGDHWKAFIENVQENDESRWQPTIYISDCYISGEPSICTGSDIRRSRISGAPEIRGATIHNSAVNGDVKVVGECVIFSSTLIGKVEVHDRSRVEDSFLSGSAVVKGTTEIEGSTLEESVAVEGDCSLLRCFATGTTTISDRVAMKDSRCSGATVLSGDRRVDRCTLISANSVTQDVKNAVLNKDQQHSVTHSRSECQITR